MKCLITVVTIVLSFVYVQCYNVKKSDGALQTVLRCHFHSPNKWNAFSGMQIDTNKFKSFILLESKRLQMSRSVPNYVLNNGIEIPAIALGTYLGFENGANIKSNGVTLKAVESAIDVGYRHIDTASIYGTEEEIGEGIRNKIKEGVIVREDMFVTTKLWNSKHRRLEVKKALRESLKNLNMDFVDLYLVHWPMAINDDQTFMSVDIMETWRGMEDVYSEGLARSIGLSNFNLTQIKRILTEGYIKPAVLQIEIHLQMTQEDLIAFSVKNNITLMAYSPFGSLVKRFNIEFPGPKVDTPLLVELGKKYGKTSTQIVLAWLASRGIIPIPKTINPSRLKENIDIFDIKLNQEEICEINKFNSNTRYTLPSFWQDHPDYPFEKIENPIPYPFKL